MKRLIIGLCCALGVSTFALSDSSFVAPSAIGTASTPLAIALGGCNSTSGCVVAGKITKVTSSQTITRATGIKFVQISCLGGGGAGGGATSGAANTGVGGGGGSGGMSWVNLNAPAADYVITIGAGGTVGTAGNNAGNNGGATSVVVNSITVCAASGGTGGGGSPGNAIAVGGGGGALGTGDFTTVGNSGGSANGPNLITFLSISGFGAPSVLGGGVPGIVTAGSQAGTAGNVYGAGGSGGNSFANAGAVTGGAGGAGVVFITEFTNQ